MATNVLKLSEIIITNPHLGAFPDLLKAIGERAVVGDKTMMEIDLKPDYPDTPRNWEMQVEAAFTWAGR